MSATQDFVRELRVGDPLARLILRTIADFADWRTGECWPSLTTLSWEAEVSERTIVRKLKELEEKNFIKIVSRKGHDGRNLSNLITLCGYADWRSKIVVGVNSNVTIPTACETGPLLPHRQDPTATQSPKPINRTYTNKNLSSNAHDKPLVTIPPSDEEVFNEGRVEESKNKKPSIANPTSQVEPVISWSKVLSEGQDSRATLVEGKLVLVPEFRAEWLELFGGDEQSLNLALIQIVPLVSPAKAGTALELQVSSQLARLLRDSKDRDKRYSAAVEAKKPKAKAWTPSRW